MSGVDVLAVMDSSATDRDDAAIALRQVGEREAMQDHIAARDAMREARAAVSDLIEAAAAFDAGEYHDNESESHLDYRDRRRAERVKLRAALSRVRGAA